MILWSRIENQLDTWEEKGTPPHSRMVITGNINGFIR